MGFRLQDEVGLVVAPSADESAVARAGQALESAGAAIVRGEAARLAPVTVWVGQPAESTEVAEVLERLGMRTPADLAPEGYVLGSGRADGRQHVVLAGRDANGTFHAAQSFRELLVKRPDHSWVPEMEIVDYPEMTIRGTIEGFYGPPWSHEARLRHLVFLGDRKMNTYVYAPKDDPYHRDRWRDPYPPDRLAEIAELVAAARMQHVNFVFAISPGVSVCYSDDREFEALAAKAQAMWDVGVRHFGILLDDIDPTLRCEQDRARFGSDPNPPAAAQAYLLNRLQDEFILTHDGPGRLVTVPTDYYQPGPTPYRERFAELVDPEVVVYWTGIGVVAPTITRKDADRIHDIFEHDLLIWDNYPVNDYARQRLLLGPLMGREPRLTEHGVVGLTANPMNEAETSKIALFTVADYAWNSDAYDARSSWELSLQRFGGAAADALRTFAENTYSSPINFVESPTLTPLIQQFWAAFEDGRIEHAASALAREFDTLRRVSAELRRTLPNEAFLDEVAEWLDKLRLYGLAGAAAVDMLLAREEAERQQRLRSLSAARRRTARNPKLMAPGVLDPFLDRAAMVRTRRRLPGTTQAPP